MSYAPRPQNFQRLNELLDAIKEEFENVNNEASNFRLHKNEYDIKFSQQTNEMQQIRQTVYELEMAHRKIKEAYEDQIKRLKSELDMKDRQLASVSQQHHQHTGSNGANNLPKPAQFAHESSANTPQQPPSQLPPVQQQIPQSQQFPPQPAQQLPPVAAQQTPVQPKAETPAAPNASIQPQQTAPPTATPAAQPASTAATPASGTNATPTSTAAVPANTAVSAPAAEGNNYLVPAHARPLHNKQIPPFLVDLDSNTVAPQYKTMHPEYYILYNPALPKSVDVELVHSLDHSSVVCCVRFSNDGKFLATGCNKTTQVFGVETGELVARLSDDNTAAENAGSSADLYIRSVCFSPDGKYLATGAEDKVIRVWDLSTRRITKYLKGHEQDIYSLDFFPDGQRLVSGSGDRTVRIWDLASGQCSLTLSIEDGVTTVAVSPDGKLIAAGSLDRTVRVWDSSTGFLVERLDSENEAGTGHKDSVYSVAFTSNGSEVASGSLDRTVKLWSLKQLGTAAATSPSKNVTACEVTYVGHKDFVLSVCSSPDGNYILSGSKDRGVIFWEKATGDPLLMLQGHRNSVISVSVANTAISGAGMFATGSGDCKARIWRWNNVSGSAA
ncbi:CYFA0S01e15544g1_1 [Cyberlindnera fabianii]|uniref:CYFA0S01e15544g1_1 n=1 Tax=Cyberlindnera fabianii TaxID=36022 RepID=A0A061AQR0_CYBFA|nr:General transcriptional corepressor TUP1 [Cyberlindnera fabianii]CDR37713.1 CYFA0S01e15544g1_1 [Cyberlindnera fabianii]